MSGYLLIPLGGGLASAVFYLSVRAGSPMAAGLTYLAPAPLLAVGLSRGLTAGAMAVLVGALALALGSEGARSRICRDRTISAIAAATRSWPNGER